MWKTVFFCASLVLGLAAADAQTGGAQSLNVDVANMRADLTLLTQRVGELSLRVEQLERDNAALRTQTANSAQAYATVQQLNDAISDLNRAIKSGDAAVSDRTAAQIKKLGDATNAALDSLAKGQAQRATVPTTFSDNFPSDGISYTVQKGDSLALIARKTGGKTQDIINANKITDPSKILVGQTLFIPGGK
ncbi:MAG TPA: LysM peptidoglycan-binding domain-containing protein [Rariglobus sp.]|nr:LysM peptidoglycan-binding domain-containing protein [Rariglobus sp.]